MTSAPEALLWCLAVAGLWLQFKENRRLRAELSDTEQANEGLTEELNAYREEEHARDAAVERVWLQ